MLSREVAFMAFKLGHPFLSQPYTTHFIEMEKSIRILDVAMVMIITIS